MFERLAAIHTGALTDVLFELGYGSQTLPCEIGGLRPGMRLAGAAFPLESRPGPPPQEYDETSRAWEMFESVPAGHVAVYATGGGEHAVIGDLAIALLKARGCTGVVVDGGCRDIELILAIGLPVFCRFTTPLDISHGRGEVVGWGNPVDVGEVRVSRGDVVVADSDGVVVIPAALAQRVLGTAEDLVEREARIRAALLEGLSPDQAYTRNPTRPPRRLDPS